jgi:hypothetical protein
MIAFTTLSIPSDTGKEMYKMTGLSAESLQAHLPNHPAVLHPNGSGIERIGKRRLEERLQVRMQELNESEPLKKHRKRQEITPKTCGLCSLQGEVQERQPVHAACIGYGVKMAGTAFRFNYGNGEADRQCESKRHKWGFTMRPKVEKCLFVADEAVVVQTTCESREERRASRNSQIIV